MRNRLDHGRMYMWIVGSLFVLSLGLLLYGPLPNTALDDLSRPTQYLLNAAMFLGSSICIYGMIRGPNAWFKKDHDIRISYNLAMSGAPAIVASLLTYCGALFDFGNFVPSALGAVVSVGIVGGTLHNVWDFRKERNRITRNMRLFGEPDFSTDNDDESSA